MREQDRERIKVGQKENKKVKQTKKKKTSVSDRNRKEIR